MLEATEDVSPWDGPFMSESELRYITQRVQEQVEHVDPSWVKEQADWIDQNDAVTSRMSDEEILGILRMIQEQLNRMEARQIEVKSEVEAAPVVGSFASKSDTKTC